MSSSEASREEPTAPAISFAYVPNFAALASSAPFFAVYLAGRGFEGEEISSLLAALLLVNIVATLGWSALADRIGSIGAVLRIVTVGSLVCAVPAFFGSRHAVVVGLVCLAAFRAPFGALLDTLVLRTERSFGPVRAWGTAGYVAGAVAAGLVTKLLGARGIAFSTMTLLALAALAGFFIPSARASLSSRGYAPLPPARSPMRELRALLRLPRFQVLLVIALLSEVGLAPYDALFPAYLTNLSDGVFAAAALAMGAISEFLFLLGLGHWTRRSSAATLLVFASGCSTLRWALLSFVTAPYALVAIQCLHCFSFGAFYVASITIVNDESSMTQRTTSQGLFRAFTFGLAPATALFVAGKMQHLHGLRGVFFVGAIAAGVATALSAKLRLMISHAKTSDVHM
jgi:PPP family 3-phenylpropionic acid transporter